MGAFEFGSGEFCDGDDVLRELKEAFGDPTSDKYKYAKSNNTFGNIQNVAGNYKNLIAAYKEAGLTVSSGWAAYLKLLGTVSVEGPQQGPQNIYDIAQFRYNCLMSDEAMTTVVHDPDHGGHVHTRRGVPNQPNTVDSPWPLPGAAQ